MSERIVCAWCGKKSPHLGPDLEEAARHRGWLVGVNAMCPECAGPEVCDCECEPCRRYEHCAKCDEHYARGGEDGALHVVPRLDLVVHATTSECVCGPECRPVEREDGSMGWLYVHHSLDGRELATAEPRQEESNG